MFYEGIKKIGEATSHAITVGGTKTPDRTWVEHEDSDIIEFETEPAVMPIPTSFGELGVGTFFALEDSLTLYMKTKPLTDEYGFTGNAILAYSTQSEKKAGNLAWFANNTKVVS